MLRLIRLMHRGRHRQFGQGHHGHGPIADPSRGQGRILALLKLRDGLPTRELANILDLSISALNELLAKLERAEYIERRPSEEDGRVMLVFLTEKGRQLEQHIADFDKVVNVLNDDEKQQLISYLDRMIAAMEEELGESANQPDFFEHLHQMFAEKRGRGPF
jgi:DNA-binding MarR family transcriptional regulator